MLHRKFVLSPFTPPTSLTDFAHLDRPVTLQRFPCMIAYLLPSDSLPPVFDAAPGTPLISILPNHSHFRKASALVHTDKHSGSGDYFKCLSEGWRLWKPYFHNYSTLETESESDTTMEAMYMSSREMD